MPQRPKCYQHCFPCFCSHLHFTQRLPSLSYILWILKWLSCYSILPDVFFFLPPFPPVQHGHYFNICNTLSACGLLIPVCHDGLVALSLVSFVTMSQIRELVPESQAYMDLLAFERKLDQTIMRKRLDIQEALKRPIKVGSNPHNPVATAVEEVERFGQMPNCGGCVVFFHFEIKKWGKCEGQLRRFASEQFVAVFYYCRGAPC